MATVKPSNSNTVTAGALTMPTAAKKGNAVRACTRAVATAAK